ncbi:MAG: metallophosphoesterase family protein [Candidatus Thiodiazotropha lotti]|uniref:metallophosphoesterase family protein n=1 Tax=Candidatus Thiodiazotropha endoloripes TaxID=1818881 RepID=UPI00083DA0BF|nr:metallophosphoesterase [Candidatus Thiodiazotropha endoloripes]MCG7904794.1 metallophosphoesterase family protein [Candidatus Thiodiazotropha weberae]MCG7991205.1 metallophosphoesterase family protein [Candidatus Thiodiazotropha lotti]MCG7998231.1 metallophosphoesterase family protein [Candidatus Thiodiazotropha lotti]MCW4182860.1 metallophosphoesterase family protein [Candidatus Thiodiazotropha weberae]MCW4189997.1 metallophosphoesterase family protein [Candidatus Thiodiazotropha weberae]
MRIFTVSDIHIDFAVNEQWIANLSDSDYLDDCLILAGDISDSEALIARCFDQLMRKFKAVFYVPGNHDIWVRKDSLADSIEKFFKLLELAQQHQVITEPKRLNGTSIVPLFSWYDLSFGTMSDTLLGKWMDFSHCKWPESLETPEAQNRFFLGKNKLQLAHSSERVITFSHFLPRIDVMPDFIPHRFRDIYPVLGSPQLDQQVRALDSDIHIYGHSHVNRSVKIKGVRYINNAFGYPSETRIAAKVLLEIDL